MNNSTQGVIVWCYSSQMIFYPFDPFISNELERKYAQSSIQQNSYSRFPVDTKKSSTWSKWQVDFQTMKLENSSTGACEMVCRKVCGPDSVFSKGYVWGVKNERARWIYYDFDTSQLIENTFTANDPKSLQLDLRTQNGLPYIIDLKNNTQTNVHTGKQRGIQRSGLSPRLYTSITINPPDSVKSADVTGTSTDGADQVSATAVRSSKRLKIVQNSSANSRKKLSSSAYQATASSSTPLPSLSSLASPQPLCADPESLTSTEVECVTESLPCERNIAIVRDKKSKEKKDDSNIDKYMIYIVDEVDDDCIICLEKLMEISGFSNGEEYANEIVSLSSCGHFFHKLCLLAMYETNRKDNYLECPSCKTIYGEKTGNCPPGKMLWEILKTFHIPGYEDFDVIRVIYFISPGIQGLGDPKPGSRYSATGFPRTGYLPDCNKGRKVLKLLVEAFKRKLMFTIGTSMTTGRTDTVVWNEIHLKTEPTSNYSGHGYPDPGYLDNVLMELASHGLREDILKNDNTHSSN